MNWTKMSAIAEITSSVAIVLTLIYLAVQTQQNTSAILVNSRNAVIDTDVQLINQLVVDPAIEASFTKPGRLTDLEAIRLENFLIGVARTREHQWIQYQNGLLDEQTWRSFMSAMPVILSYPRTRPWWERARANGYFDDDFMDEVENILEGTPMYPAEYTYPFTYDLR